jgi:DNA-binding MarR family transcriptional regulator
MTANPFDALMGYHLRRLSVLVMADLTTRLSPLGLKPADASVLTAIKTHAPITQSDLGRMLGIQRANMTPLIAALDRRGFIQRDAVDGRSQALRLTAEGLDIQEKSWAILQAHEAQVFGTLTTARRNKMASDLQQLWANFPQAEEE